MTTPTSPRGRRIALGLAVTAAAGLGAVGWLAASDHKDGPITTEHSSIDLTDLYAFRSPADSSNLVLVMNIHGFIPPAEAASTFFDPRLLYEFRIDTDGDAVEDQIIQARVMGSGANQTIRFWGPTAPLTTGSTSLPVAGNPAATVEFSGPGDVNVATGGGLKVFAGVREDPFFFDFARFTQIRMEEAETFRIPGMDTFAGTNVLSMVAEFPISMLGGRPEMGVWMTVSMPGLIDDGMEMRKDMSQITAADVYDQVDRQGFPGVGVLFIPKTDMPAFNRLAPAADPANYADEIVMTIVEEYNQPRAEATEIADMLTPDILPIDVSEPTDFPNGRWLGDDVVDVVLMQLFEGREGLNDDNVASNDKPFLPAFPYLAPPYTQ